MQPIKSVYKISDASGKTYIGSTNNPKRRLIEHKSTLIGLDKSTATIQVLCTTKNFENLESSLVQIELKNNKQNCLNKTKNGKSGNNLVFFSDELKIKRSNQTKKMWQNEESRNKIILARKKQSKEHLLWLNKLAIQKLINNMPSYIAICKKTNKQFGPFKGYDLASKELNCCISSITRALKDGANNRKFYFKYTKDLT